ncbi:MAG: SH3 domain-containing protein [Candidatus Yanofskybacteria bacterium]|nr:SH3 domain-containing protein [Candidatus Yanofskybacteria bacterium]
MIKIQYFPQMLGRVFLILTFLTVLLTAFLLLSGRAYAADASEHLLFRVDTELNVPNAKDTSNKVTVRWYCDGASTFGEVTDNTGSESTDSLDGIIRVASNSKEMTDASCTIGASETLRASVSLDGWLEREWTVTSFPGASTAADFDVGVFTQRASMDYTIVVNGITDELSTDLTLNGGTNASASYDGTVASQSYSNYLPLGAGTWKKYIAGTTTGGNVHGYRNGYVRATTTTILTINSTTSTSVDFGTSDTSAHNESGLAFAIKAQVYERGGDFTNYKVTSGTVTAGDSLGTNCTAGTGSNAGYWYCAVPLAETDITAQFSHDNWNTTTATYTDRTAKADAQQTPTILPTRKAIGGSCASCASTEPVVTESSPTPTPEPGVSPTPIPEVTPTPMPSDGPKKLYRKVADPKVYVQGADGMLSWIRTLEDFNAAGYNWADVQVISGPEFAQLKIEPSSITAKLFRKANEPKVYVQGDGGTLTWVKTLEDFNAAGYNWADVQQITGEEFGKMKVGGQIRVVKDISFLRVRSGPSTKNAILGTVVPGRLLQFYEWTNGWYKIKKDDGSFGWVHGGYVSEI